MNHSLERERQALSCILVEPDAILQIGDLKPGMFYDPRHGLMFDACLKLHRQGKFTDITSLLDYLTGKGELEKVGGDGYIADVIGAEGTTATHIETYVKDIIEYYGQRRLHQISLEMQNALGRGSTTQEVITNAQDQIAKIQLGVSGDVITGIDKLSIEAFERMNTASGKRIKTGIGKLDYYTGGLVPSTLTLVAARTRVGKSDFMVNLALNMSKSENVGIISLEMSDLALTDRMIANLGGIDRTRITLKKMTTEDKDNAGQAMSILQTRKIHISDTSGLDARTVCSKISLMQKKYGIGIAFVDHLHRIKFSNSAGKTHDNRREVAEIIADTSRKLKLPIVCMAQLNRDNARENKIPIIEQIRDAGEDDADLILMLWREGAYESPDHDTLKVIIGKNRSGQAGVAECNYDLKTGRIGQTDEAPF